MKGAADHGSPVSARAGKERRRHVRWHAPVGVLPAEIATPALRVPVSIADVSAAGFGIRVGGAVIKEGTSIRLVVRERNLSLRGEVRNVRHDRVGVVSGDSAVLTELVRLAMDRRACAARGANGRVSVQGFLGFNARWDLRLSRPIEEIDMRGAAGIDSFGLGILLAHMEKGCRVSGCSGEVAHLVGLAGLCGRYCKTTTCAAAAPGVGRKDP